MKIPRLSRFAVAGLALIGFTSSSLAGPQIGLGPALVFSEDDTSLGFDAEAGFGSRGNVVDSFFGANLFYAGLDKEIFDDGFSTSADVDYMVLHGVLRLMVPLTSDKSLSLYGEGGLGGTYIDTQLDRASSNVAEWAFSYSLGAGIDYSFNEIIGIRAGYHYIGFEEVRGFDSAISESGLGALKIGFTLNF